MLDLETLGTKAGCVVLSIAAVAFNPGVPITRGMEQEFYQNIDIFDQLMKGLVIRDETVDWWRDQSADAQNALYHPAPLPLWKVAIDFVTWIEDIGGIDCVWAKSPDFDCAVWEHCADLVKVDVPWTFRSKRDVRTALDIPNFRRSAVPVTPPPQPSGVKHNALDDCYQQIRELQYSLGV